MKTALVTDGSCDLPPDVATAHAIEVVPHHVIWGTHVYTDSVDLTSDEFYERLVRDPLYPKTAQPSSAEFAAGFRHAREAQQADSILCVCLSQVFSGAYN